MTKELVITEKISKKICQELMLGTPLVRIARDKDMPSLTKIYKWIAEHKEFANSIQDARRIGAQSYIEKAMVLQTSNKVRPCVMRLGYRK